MFFIENILLMNYDPAIVQKALAEASLHRNSNELDIYSVNNENSSDYFKDTYNRANLSLFIFNGKKPSARVINSAKPETKKAYQNQILPYLRTLTREMQRYDDVFLSEVMTMHPLIDDVAFMWYVLNYPYRFGKDIIQKVLDRYVSVLFSKGNFTIKADNEKAQAFLDKPIFNGLSFDRYCEDVLPQLLVSDANAWIGAMRKSDLEDDVSIVYFESHNYIGRILDIDFFVKDSVYYAFSQSKTYEMDTRFIVQSQAEIRQYQTAAKAVKRIGGKSEYRYKAPDNIIYDSFFSKGLHSILDYLQAYLEGKYNAKNNTHPYQIEAMQQCTPCSGNGFRMVSEYDNENKCHVQVKKDCNHCGGNGISKRGVIFGSKIMYNTDAITENAKGVQPISYSQPIVSDIPDKRTADKLQQVFKAFSLEGIFAAQSGLAKQEDSRELQDNISKFGSSLFDLIQFLGKTALYAYKNSDVMVRALQVHAPNPSTYNLQSYEQQLEVYTKLAQASGTDLTLQNDVLRRLIETGSSDTVIKKYQLLQVFKPFFGLKPDVVNTAIAQKSVAQKDVILYFNAENLVNELFDKYGFQIDYMDNAVLLKELQTMGDKLVEDIKSQDPTDKIADMLKSLSEPTEDQEDPNELEDDAAEDEPNDETMQ